MQKIEDFTSHTINLEITAATPDSGNIQVIDISQNNRYKSQLRGMRGYQFMQSHLRLTFLRLEFQHDGISLPRLEPPKIDELLPDFEKELLVREWMLFAPKRIVELWFQGKQLAAPAEFIYTERGLINEFDYMAPFGDKETIVADESLALSIPGGLKGEEKLRVYCAWNEYFSVWLK